MRLLSALALALACSGFAGSPPLVAQGVPGRPVVDPDDPRVPSRDEVAAYLGGGLGATRQSVEPALWRAPHYTDALLLLGDILYRTSDVDGGLAACAIVDQIGAPALADLLRELAGQSSRGRLRAPRRQVVRHLPDGRGHSALTLG